MPRENIEKPAFASQLAKTDKRRAGRTKAEQTPIELRSGDETLGDGFRTWIHERLGRQLGKYAEQIERIEVRFGDENGPKGGIDKSCLIHAIVSSLPGIVVEERGADLKEAFDRAAGRIERAMRRAVQRHGFSMKTKRGSTHGGRAKRALRTEASNLAAASRPATKRKGGDSVPAQVGAAAMTMREPQGSLVGRRVGRAKQNVLDAAARPEKKQRDVYVDTSEPATSADQRKVGYGHTAKRNTKLNTAGMAYSIEDSTKARPSRKSTRGATNRIKTGGNLTRRTKRRLHGPKSRASRANPS